MSIQPRWELLKATFPSQQKAANWAWHVARVSQRRCKVARQSGAWRVWRDTSNQASDEVEVQQ